MKRLREIGFVLRVALLAILYAPLHFVRHVQREIRNKRNPPSTDWPPENFGHFFGFSTRASPTYGIEQDPSLIEAVGTALKNGGHYVDPVYIGGGNTHRDVPSEGVLPLGENPWKVQK